MPISKDDARQKVAELVAKFQALAPADVRRFNEENTKKDFILPLFRALGWDVDSSEEVAAEEKASGGRVDYAFKLGGVSRFFVEAKPLDANLTDPKYIKQAIEYALNRGVSWAVLTNFQEVHLFYALGETDKPEALRWKTLKHTDFIQHFDSLWLLSRESIESGATDEEARIDGKLPPRLSIEQRLFKQFREWREQLTNYLRRFHKDELSPAQVDEVVERLFNRLIFIRTCEDRKIEDRVLWHALQDWLGKKRKANLVASVRRIFDQFRDWYDSDLFPEEPHLLDDPKRVHLDDDLLGEIVKGLYTIPGGYADYDFSLIDADVLGAVYEQYLGYVAQAVKEYADRRARQLALTGMAPPPMELVEKRAKRKQQGIYYTPKWVVDYIVRQTVGKALDETGRAKGAAEDRLFSLRVLDPACGSGSFLIRAYDELLRRAAALSGRSEEHVFQDERGEIVKHSIFGVDLDPQAVDIARLNLMLRGLSKRDKLPLLKDNVQMGNSLISGGEAELKPFFGDAWEAKHPFNWEERFPDVMREGGFDVVIGNPPYVRIQSLPREDADYYRDRYESAHGSFDLYVMFIERGLKLLKPGGRLGFITSGKFLKAEYGKKLQALINREATVETVVDLSAHQVFGEATTYPVMLILQEGTSKRSLIYVQLPPDMPLPQANEPFKMASLRTIAIPQASLQDESWPPVAKHAPISTLAKKVENVGVGLEKFTDGLFQGLRTSDNKVFVVQRVASNTRDGTTQIFSKATNREHKLDTELLRPWIPGEAIDRYAPASSDLFVIVPYAISAEGYKLLSEDELADRTPKTWAYLKQNKARLTEREKGKMDREGWYGYVYPKNLHLFPRPKLLTADTAKTNSYTADLDGTAWFTSGYGLCVPQDDSYLLKYLLGLLNSRLMTSLFAVWSTQFRGGYNRFFTKFQRRFPIRRIDPANKTDVEMRDRIVRLVERMLDVKKRIAAKGDAHDNERDDLEREAARTDREIDGAVYDLYGLTEAERELVGEETRR